MKTDEELDALFDRLDRLEDTDGSIQVVQDLIGLVGDLFEKVEELENRLYKLDTLPDDQKRLQDKIEDLVNSRQFDLPMPP